MHIEHGIGQYQGLREIASGDGAGEFMILEYAETMVPAVDLGSMGETERACLVTLIRAARRLLDTP